VYYSNTISAVVGVLSVLYVAIIIKLLAYNTNRCLEYKIIYCLDASTSSRKDKAVGALARRLEIRSF
jgi:hypothetical protein